MPTTTIGALPLTLSATNWAKAAQHAGSQPLTTQPAMNTTNQRMKNVLGRDAGQQGPPVLEGSSRLRHARLLFLHAPPLRHRVYLLAHLIQQLLHFTAFPRIKLQRAPFEAAGNP